MKCPECHANHQYKAGMTCRCGYGFLLDPKSDGIADGKFLAYVRRASANDTYYFTANQFYTVVCRDHRRNPVPWFVGFGLFMVAILVSAFAFRQFLPLFGAGALGTGVVSLVLLFYRPPSRQTVDGWLERWFQSGREIERLIREPRLHEPPPEWPESDIYDYGVEGIVLVQHDLLVDLLVLNDVHGTQRVLVLSESGYPEYLLPVGRRCLEEHPELPVYLLHDSDAAGLAMRDRVAQSDLLPLDGHPIVDLGLTPDDVRKIGMLQATHPDRYDYSVPVDMLPQGMLATGLGLAMSGQMSFAELLAREEEQGDAHVASFG